MRSSALSSTVRWRAGTTAPTATWTWWLCAASKAVEGRIWKLAGKYLIETGVVFQPFVVSPEEYEAIQRRGSAFAHAVRDEGEVLA